MKNLSALKNSNNKEKHKGFTLIELMLASSLLMMIMFSGYYAYSLYSNKWDKRTNEFWENTQSVLGFDTMNRVIESTYPYIINSDKKEPAIYYSASPSQVTFVSHSAIFTKELAIVQLKVVDKNDIKMIVYRESSLNELYLLNQADDINWQYQVIIIDNLSYAEFSYFGWEGLTQVLENINSDEETTIGRETRIIQPMWYSIHDMAVQRIIPIKIKIQLKDLEGKNSDFSLALPENSHEVILRYLREDA